jgi:hypothetical protein
MGSVAVFCGVVGPGRQPIYSPPSRLKLRPKARGHSRLRLICGPPEGDIGQFGLPEVHVDLSFLDILNHFDVGVEEARHDRFDLLTDLMYIKLRPAARSIRGSN